MISGNIQKPSIPTSKQRPKCRSVCSKTPSKIPPCKRLPLKNQKKIDVELNCLECAIITKTNANVQFSDSSKPEKKHLSSRKTKTKKHAFKTQILSTLSETD